MADGSGPSRDRPSGRIKPGQADQVLIAAMIHVAASVHDDTDRDVALHLMARALPMISPAPRVQALAQVAGDVLAAARHRRKVGEGARRWLRVNLDLSAAVARDALRQALAKVEV